MSAEFAIAMSAVSEAIKLALMLADKGPSKDELRAELEARVGRLLQRGKALTGDQAGDQAALDARVPKGG